MNGQTPMTIAKHVLYTALTLASIAWQSTALAQAGPQSASSAPVAHASPGTEYSEKGADTCLECHDAESDTATFSTAGIFKSKHGHRKNARSPFGPKGLQCEACHGPGDRHSTQKAKKSQTIISLKANSGMKPAQRNEVCLACHQNQPRNAWHAEAHDRAQLACTDCHKMHVARDPVLTKTTEPNVCFSCHKKEQGEFHKTSAHPVRQGKMACSDCHNAHGSSTMASLNKPTLNQTCYACHAEKRGPMLWEHAPVTEDCSLCHTSHGSVRPAMLTANTTSLCQSCHSVAGHPAVPRTGAALPGGGGGGSIFVVNGGCTNCHAQVHGSNHPSGAKLLR